MSAMSRTGFELARSQARREASRGLWPHFWWGVASGLKNFAGAAEEWEFAGMENELVFLTHRVIERKYEVRK